MEGEEEYYLVEEFGTVVVSDLGVRVGGGSVQMVKVGVEHKTSHNNNNIMSGRRR